MSAYRWDLHIRKVGNEDKPRCPEVARHAPVRCEYVVHAGHGHSAQDGSVVWLDADSPVFAEVD